MQVVVIDNECAYKTVTALAREPPFALYYVAHADLGIFESQEKRSGGGILPKATFYHT